MIHILKSKSNQYYFIEVSAQNGKVLATSEQHTTKRAAVQNIIASMKVFNALKVTVIDHTKQYIGKILVFDLARQVKGSKIVYKRINAYAEVMRKSWKKYEWSTRIRIHERA